MFSHVTFITMKLVAGVLTKVAAKKKRGLICNYAFTINSNEKCFLKNLSKNNNLFFSKSFGAKERSY